MLLVGFGEHRGRDDGGLKGKANEEDDLGNIRESLRNEDRTRRSSFDNGPRRGNTQLARDWAEIEKLQKKTKKSKPKPKLTEELNLKFSSFLEHVLLSSHKKGNHILSL